VPRLPLDVATDGLRSDGTFLHLGFHQIEWLADAFRRAVLRAFVQRDLLSRHDAENMLVWPHSGFHVHHAVRLEADDAQGILQLSRYAARAPVALERLQYDAKRGQVQLASDKKEGPTAGTHRFEAQEFLAQLLAHVPESHEILVRYYGAYSVRRRAQWRAAGILSTVREPEDGAHADEASPTGPQLLARRRRWAELLQRIFEVDPLACARCGATMRIVAFILDPGAIHAILAHLHKRGRDPRTAALDELEAPTRAPPA
jgi:hypothetical protein